MKVRFAVAPGLDPMDRAAFCELVDTLEALGFDTIWLSDIPLGANIVPIGRNPMLLASRRPEHHGLSIPYVRTEPEPPRLAALRARRPDADLEDILPIGFDGLRRLVSRLIGKALSKFVLRPVAPVASWRYELDWLADAVLDLQS